MSDKIQLAERLIKEGKITLEEAIVLMGEQKGEPIYVPQPYPIYPQPYQWQPPYWPIITCQPHFDTVPPIINTPIITPVVNYNNAVEAYVASSFTNN